MAKIDIKDSIDYPLETVYPAFRDDLKQVASYLPNIDEIVVKSSTRRDEETLDVVNLWVASEGEIPTLAQPFIKKDMLQWIDRAVWHDDELYCEWEMEVGFLPEAVTCRGRTTYTAKGDRTEVHIDGELLVDAKKIPGVPRLMSGKVGQVVEGFVVKMITPNLKATNRAMESHLKAQGA